MAAKMPAIISKLMPLPMPYSSICSPSHIKNTVPAVMVMTDMNCNKNGKLAPLSRSSFTRPLCTRKAT